MLRYFTAGESHGKAMVALVDGYPAGVPLDRDYIDAELARRQGGYGRGGRQKLETDRVDVLTGVWQGLTLGSPIAMVVPNSDYKLERMKELDRPRPGHGDLTGAIKYLGQIRPILERASARETTVRVAAGALAAVLLREFEITTLGYVVQVGPIAVEPKPGTLDEHRKLRDQSELYTLDPGKDADVKAAIDRARDTGNTLGGIIEVRVEGVPFGLGTHAQWDRKLDGRLSQAVMAVQAIKGVEIGMGFEMGRRPGAEVHDPIYYAPDQKNTRNLGFTRPTNNAGGLEAGMTNAQPIVIRAAKKPISTLARPLDSVNLKTLKPEMAAYERSDVCAIAAASCIVENVVAFEVAGALIDKFGGDSLKEMKARWELFYKMAAERIEDRGQSAEGRGP